MIIHKELRLVLKLKIIPHFISDAHLVQTYLRIKPLFTVVFIFSTRCSTFIYSPHITNQNTSLFKVQWTENWINRSSTHLQVFNAKFFLKDVCRVSPSSQTSHGSQVAAVPTHSLNNEHTALGPCCRLLDSVTGLQERNIAEINLVNSFLYICVYVYCWGTDRSDGVEGGVSANAEVRAGDIVGDGGGDNHHGNAHLFIFLSGLNQL